MTNLKTRLKALSLRQTHLDALSFKYFKHDGIEGAIDNTGYITWGSSGFRREAVKSAALKHAILRAKARDETISDADLKAAFGLVLELAEANRVEQGCDFFEGDDDLFAEHLAQQNALNTFRNYVEAM
jgi:hypothetical protein